MGESITDLSSVTTVGLDLAKHVFQVHAIDAFGRVIVAKALRRKDVLASSRNCPSVFKMARIAFAIMRGKTTYSAAPA